MAETHGHVGGPRHYQGPTLGQVGVWKCPACSVENSGPLEEGCPACGSGSQKARHVGVPPSRKTATAASHDSRVNSLEPATAAFEEWFQARMYADGNPAGVMKLESILREAWLSALEWVKGTPPALIVERGDAPVTLLVPKTLIERVVQTLEETTDLPDGQQSPELIGLISELKELLA